MAKAFSIDEFLKSYKLPRIRFAFTDVDGVLRGKFISTEKFADMVANGAGFCDVVFGWDSADSLYRSSEADLTGWHTGFPDQLCQPDASTLRFVPWQDGTAFFIADFSQSAAGETVCPRSLLKRVVQRGESMGYSARFAQEFEWFNFLESPQSLSQKDFRNPEPLSPGMFGYSILRTSQRYDYNKALFDELTAFGIGIEGLHTETGPGVYEAAIAHDETLAAADKAVLFKNGVKEIASRFNIMASFMAKWNDQLPGCSGHIHQSLYDNTTSANLFFDAGAEGHMSELMKHYIAGQLYCMSHIMPMYAPTVNSYKRLVEGAWAPTNLSWGIENRTATLRVINNSEKLMRLETRLPGADSNPYLAIAAAFASGLYGIAHQLPLRVSATSGNAYQAEGALPLHSNLYDATVAMRDSAVAKELFGNGFVRHFTQTRLHEWSLYERAVTNWELKRYFEII